ncbi:hypothetical protein BDP55DRAFT_721926 [Colletotrichum godetiae]|uniref:Uncharacterized protein n=1 Tax=Colletotrichum godetiae TaxID=1209918 RepID=A0AAJ0ELV8_9PEZI|nr:uncharacterized protein BDP55DRAFT_721926 [Colletotrichum godetiae]KAK1656761.1 hypothetical protein BDP55DRAFT_721926 [Colletotrichum godetiae]
MPQLPQMDTTAEPMPPFARSHGPMPNRPPMPAATSGYCTACPRLALSLVRESLDGQPTRMLSGSALAVAAQDMKSEDRALIGWANVSLCMPKAGRLGTLKREMSAPRRLCRGTGEAARTMQDLSFPLPSKFVRLAHPSISVVAHTSPVQHAHPHPHTPS